MRIHGQSMRTWNFFIKKNKPDWASNTRELLSVSDQYPPPSNLVLKVCLKCPFYFIFNHQSLIHRPPSLPSIPIQLNDYEPRKGKKIGVTISFNNHRLFVGNIPKNRDRDELLEEFTKHARKGQMIVR